MHVLSVQLIEIVIVKVAYLAWGCHKQIRGVVWYLATFRHSVQKVYHC